jgi:DNA-binding winged helix-turn-helix (wHTH) protein/tetratricopeptide (TPR) repeat protein
MAVYSFGSFEVDTDRGVLRRAGLPIELGRKPVDLLAHLVRNAGQPLSHEELLDEVWHVQCRSRSTVPTAIAALRRALGDDARNPRFIETVPGRGYCFVAPLPAGAGPDGGLPEGAMLGLVGRDAELARVGHVLRSVQHAGSQSLFFYGEAGIGKTRLLEAVRDMARLAGVRCTFVRCREDEGAPPLQAWLEVLRSPALAHEATQADATALLEHIESGRLGTSLAGGTSRAEARFRLFTGVSNLIRKRASRGPVALVFDDLDRADRASLVLLNKVLAETRDANLLVAAAFRDVGSRGNAENAAHLSLLRREPGVLSLPLAPLTRDQVARLAAGLLPPERSRAELVAELHDRSGGNLFLLTQLLELVKSNFPVGDGSPLPRGLRGLVLSQLGDLGPRSTELLEACAVAGREIRLGVLAGALGIPDPELLGNLAPIVGRRLLTAVTGRHGVFRFAHALVRDTLYEELPPGRRAALHQAIGEALGRVHGDDPLFAAELAHHFLHSQPEEGARKAVHYATLAANAAADHLAYEDVPRHLRRALGALALAPDVTVEEQCVLLLSLGRAEVYAGERARGRETLREAAALARRAGDADLLARSALSLAPGPLAIEVGVYDPLLVSLLEEALARVPKDQPARRTELSARLSLALASGDAEERRQRLAAEAIATAAETTDVAAQADALIARHRTLGGPGHLTERLAVAKAMGDLHDGEDDTHGCLHRILRVTTLLEKGTIDAVDREIALLGQDVRSLGVPPFRWYVPLYGSMRALMTGRLDSAGRLAREFRDLGERGADENAAQSYGAHHAIQLWERGRAAEATPLIESHLERFPANRPWRSGLAFCLYDSGRPIDARRHFDCLAHESFEDIPHNELWTSTLITASFTCTWLRDAERAQILYDLLRGGEEQYAVLGFGVVCLGSIAQYLGMLAGTLERWEDACRHFELARRQNERIGALQWVAHTHLEWARMLVLRGNLREARHEAGRAWHLARSLELRNVERKARALGEGALPG